MKDLDIKGTIYDLFGYLMPGALLLTLGFIAILHSNGNIDILNLIEKNINRLNARLITLLIFCLYILGHAISTLSSLVVEKLIVEKFAFISRKLSNENIFSKGLLNTFNDKFKIKFKTEFTPKDVRTVICYVESQQPAVYSTAFVFLAFYGMARNIAFVLSIFVFWELFNLTKLSFVNLSPYIFSYLTVAIIFYYQYFRFLRYFKQQIYMGFIQPEKD